MPRARESAPATTASLEEAATTLGTTGAATTGAVAGSTVPEGDGAMAAAVAGETAAGEGTREAP